MGELVQRVSEADRKFKLRAGGCDLSRSALASERILFLSLSHLPGVIHRVYHLWMRNLAAYA